MREIIREILRCDISIDDSNKSFDALKVNVATRRQNMELIFHIVVSFPSRFRLF